MIVLHIERFRQNTKQGLDGGMEAESSKASGTTSTLYYLDSSRFLTLAFLFEGIPTTGKCAGEPGSGGRWEGWEGVVVAVVYEWI